MAFALEARRAIPDGQITATVYGFIRDGQWADAVEVLSAQLQVRRRARLALRVRSLPRRPRARVDHHSMQRPPPALSPLARAPQERPDSREALSLLGHCHYQAGDFEAAAQM